MAGAPSAVSNRARKGTEVTIAQEEENPPESAPEKDPVMFYWRFRRGARGCQSPPATCRNLGSEFEHPGPRPPLRHVGELHGRNEVRRA